MITAGIDIGSVTTKVAILDGDSVLAQVISATGPHPSSTAEKTLEDALNQADLSRQDVEYIVSTGYGRRAIEFPDMTVTEITCCARGARWIREGIRTIIDLGGQDMKVIALEEDGTCIDFVMNDKCAAGTGRFLEVMASVLGLRLEDLGELSLRSEVPIQINSTCTVFAESEVISLIAQGRNREDIIAGIHSSIAQRMVNMIRQLGEKEVIFFCGGGAKNIGIHKALEDRLGMEVFVPKEPQFVIALGAALIAREYF